MGKAEAGKTRYGGLVKAMRRSRNLTQTQLALLAGMSRPAISMIEAGKQNLYLDTFIALARAMGYEAKFHLKPKKPDERPTE